MPETLRDMITSSSYIDTNSNLINPRDAIRRDASRKQLDYLEPIDQDIDGQEVDISLLVPELSDQELRILKTGQNPTNPIVNKAVNQAVKRVNSGKSAVASFKEQMLRPNVTMALARETQQNEGQKLFPYRDSNNTIAIGDGLNLTVQDDASLKARVGENLYNKFKSFVGKKWSALSKEDKNSLRLDPMEADELSFNMAQYNMMTTAHITTNMSSNGKRAVAQLAHWAGTNFYDSNKLSVMENGSENNPFGILAEGTATDADVKKALQIFIKNTDSDWKKRRAQSMLKQYF